MCPEIMETTEHGGACDASLSGLLSSCVETCSWIGQRVQASSTLVADQAKACIHMHILSTFLLSKPFVLRELSSDSAASRKIVVPVQLLILADDCHLPDETHVLAVVMAVPSTAFINDVSEFFCLIFSFFGCVGRHVPSRLNS